MALASAGQPPPRLRPQIEGRPPIQLHRGPFGGVEGLLHEVRGQQHLRPANEQPRRGRTERLQPPLHLVEHLEGSRDAPGQRVEVGEVVEGHRGRVVVQLQVFVGAGRVPQGGLCLVVAGLLAEHTAEVHEGVGPQLASGPVTDLLEQPGGLAMAAHVPEQHGALRGHLQPLVAPGRAVRRIQRRERTRPRPLQEPEMRRGGLHLHEPGRAGWAPGRLHRLADASARLGVLTLPRGRSRRGPQRHRGRIPRPRRTGFDGHVGGQPVRAGRIACPTMAAAASARPSRSLR